MSINRLLLIGLLLLSFSCKKDKNAPLPVANFFVEIDSCINEKCYVHLFDNSENSVKWNWNFDNGLSSESKNATSIFNKFKAYNIVLQVENIDGVKVEKIKNITF